jgi:hypothetical protein
MCVTNCRHCGRPVGQPGRGRHRRYCRPLCRQRAYRRRRALLVAAMRSAGMGEYVGGRWADYRARFPWQLATG